MEEEKFYDRPSLDHWLGVFRRSWWLVAACVVLVGGSAAAFSLTRTKQYTATASLYFTQSPIGAELLGITVNSSSATQQSVQADDVKLVQSPDVAVLVSQSRAFRGQLTPSQINQDVTVSSQGQSDFVGVQVESPNPAFAARLANSYARHFIAFRARSNRAAVLQVRNSLGAQLQAMTPAERSSSTGASLRARIEQLDTLAAAQTGDAQLAQPAAVPDSPSYPKTKLNIGIGAALGLLLGIGLMLLRERLTRTVRDVEELGRLYGLPILAQVPEDDALSGDDRGSAALRSATFEMLRAQMRYFNVDRELKSVLVTSCLPEEGKTTVAWNLARAAALAGSNVLLLEADLRRPSLAKQHRLQPWPGLAEVLAGEADLAGARQTVAIAVGRKTRTFDVLAAGAVPPNPAELIESERMKEFLRDLGEEYELTVIDSGPALVVSDPLAMMGHVGGVLVVSRVGRSTRQAAEQLREQLASSAGLALGIVANRVKGRDGGYYEYYGYSHSLSNGRPRPSSDPSPAVADLTSETPSAGQSA